ncbi:MAG: aquaporin [Euryarchaeota archaeon]|jgi:glycerol uptake facilitator-like aquaporin|nr:aquaporin [Euryarchaeota archaeon]MBF15061.1 aquaporin [Euryarchaeota archaeon]|tara:strand:+ start:729 stop:1337 length:609 start_codon:yes stop_codon:yes gene_type:complete
MWKRGSIEAGGTFAMVLVGCGSVAMERSSLEVSIAFGLIVASVIVVIGRWSGAHINPAVSIAFWYRGNLSGKDAVAHVVGQMVGALCAGFLLNGAGPTVRNTSWLNLIGIEIFITFLLMASILWIIRKTDQWIPIGIVVGATVAILAFLFGQYTGASMNPARTFGPNLISGDAVLIPVYFVCTVIGALLAVVVERFIPSTSE